VERSQFDCLAKTIATAGSRRRVIAAALGGALALAGITSSGAAARCRNDGVVCSKNADCCGGNCLASKSGRRVCCSCSSYVLAGGPSITDHIEVDDDLTVKLNGAPIFVDTDGNYTVANPISFTAKPGDQLEVIATNVVAGGWGLSPLYLFCEDCGTSQVLDPAGVAFEYYHDSGVFYDRTFTIK
jgi:hypothetical protein